MGLAKNKCLLTAGGKPLLEWTILTLKQLKFPEIIVVTRSTDSAIESFFNRTRHKNITVAQDPFFLGAGHALFVGASAVNNPHQYKYVLCLYGDDSFLYEPATISDFLSGFSGKNTPLRIMTTKREVIGTIGGLKRDSSNQPNGFYTRSELDSLHLATAEIVCGAFLLKSDWLKKHFHKIVKNDKSGELMLTSLIGVAHNEKTPASVFELQNKQEWCGVNTTADLKLARQLKNGQLKNG